MPDLDVPVVMLVFNRPEPTARVFERVREAKPRRVLVVADGPRENRPGEGRLCEQTRQVVVDQIDWECDVQVNVAESNLGCLQRVSSGLDWVFEQVDRAIILEDDCLVDPTFFRYAGELLERYANEDQVMMIGADNASAFGDPRTSYYFSRYALIWGWATWRRAWRRYDGALSDWPRHRAERMLERVMGDREQAGRFARTLDIAHDGKINSWAIRWQYAVWAAEGVSILPTRNLVSNIGFGGDATHTQGESDRDANRPTEPIGFPMDHPAEIRVDDAADRALFEYAFRDQPEPMSRRLYRAARVAGGAVLPRGVKRWARGLVGRDS